MRPPGTTIFNLPHAIPHHSVVNYISPRLVRCTWSLKGDATFTRIYMISSLNFPRDKF